MLIIPLPKGASRGDQAQNAQIFKQNGWARVLEQSELTPETFATEIDTLMKNRVQLAEKLNRVNTPDATKKIVNILLKYAKN